MAAATTVRPPASLIAWSSSSIRQLNDTFRPLVNDLLSTRVHAAFTLDHMRTEKIRPIDRALMWARERDWDDATLALKLNTSQQRIYNWKKRGMPAAQHAAVAALFNRTVEELLGLYDPAAGAGQALLQAHDYLARATEVPIDDNPEFPAIRRVRFKLSAGASGFAIDFLDDDDAPIVFRREWFAARGLTPAALFAVRVYNGSMQPGLWEGDTVVVNTADTTPRDGEVFAVNFEGELVIKRLIRDEGRWWLKSDNPDQTRYPRKAVDEHVHLVGRIVHKQSEHI